MAGVSKKLRRCKVCKLEHKIADFQHRAGPGGRRDICKFCKEIRETDPLYQKNRMKCHNDKNKDKRRSMHLKKEYGITQVVYEAILFSQGGVCCICRGQQVGKMHRYFAVDHDHTTGKIRGLLCNNCNTGLGQFKDSISLLGAAIKYLEASLADIPVEL